MKVVTENAVYVQKVDIAFLISTDIIMPLSIMLNTFGENGGCITPDNRFEFVKFESENDIEFFSQQNWILDYNEVKYLKEDEIYNYIILLKNKEKALRKNYKKMGRNEKVNNNLLIQCDLINYKSLGLKDYLAFKQGRINMDIPGDSPKVLTK